MKHTKFLATLVGMSSIGLSSLLGMAAVTVAPAVQAAGATNCLIVRQNRYNGQELYNRCNGTIEAAWCNYSDNGCVRIDNTWTLRAGQSYPLQPGRVVFAACVGANSISRIKGTDVYCER